VNFLQVSDCDVEVFLGCVGRRMAQQLLHEADIDAAVEQMRGATVTTMLAPT